MALVGIVFSLESVVHLSGIRALYYPAWMVGVMVCGVLADRIIPRRDDPGRRREYWRGYVAGLRDGAAMLRRDAAEDLPSLVRREANSGDLSA